MEADNVRSYVNVYDIRRYGTVAFLVVLAAVVGVFLYLSNDLVKDQARQERARMQIWADATKQIVSEASGDEDAESQHMNFLLGIIEGNTTIPVLLTNDRGEIIDQRNYSLPEPDGPIDSEANMRYLRDKLDAISGGDNVIDIEIAPGVKQRLYYEDSTLLRNLSIYPYVQIVVMVAFVIVVYFAVASSKKAEQNKVWVGPAKETAHQLGTPISSLMAWVELMRDTGADPEMVDEMDKDVKRLSTIAARFSKIGSQPSREPEDLNEVVSRSATYMKSRISSRIDLTVRECDCRLNVMMSAPLIEWVLENLIKNAVDAMEGNGSIALETLRSGDNAVVTVTDTGRGMSRKMRKAVFRPGYTTKKRGWGLGLTLARRIIEEYHGGRIFVARSEPGVGTTFRIELPTDDK